MMPPVLWTTTLGSSVVYAVEDAAGVGCFLVADRSRAVLVDTGVGPTAPVPGRLPEALAFAGIAPGDVTLVVHTTLDPDHRGGDRAGDGSPAFPRAAVAVHRRELARPGIDRAILPPALTVFAGDTELAPGIAVRELPGHSPGHVAVTVTSGGQRLVVVGDAVRRPGDVEHPERPDPADADPGEARRSRETILGELAGTGALVAATHLPAPGLGYVERLGETRFFAPAVAFQVA